MATKAKSKAGKPRQEERAPSYTDVSEGSFAVFIPGRGNVSLPKTWTRTHHACGTVHSIVNTLVTCGVDVHEDGKRVMHLKYDTFDSTSDDPDTPTTTEITEITPEEGDRTATMVVSSGPGRLERTEFRRTEDEDRLLVRHVLRGRIEETWIFFDEPQQNALRVKSHSWREADKDGKEIRRCLEVKDGKIVHPPELRVEKGCCYDRSAAAPEGAPVLKDGGLQGGARPDGAEGKKNGATGKKNGSSASGRKRKGRRRGDRVSG